MLEALNLTMVGAQMDFGHAAPPEQPEERALMAALTREPRHVDEIVRESGWPQRRSPLRSHCCN